MRFEQLLSLVALPIVSICANGGDETVSKVDDKQYEKAKERRCGQ